MTIQELENKIKQIASGQGIHEQAIINRLLSYLAEAYEPKIHTEEDKELIGEIKQKITSTLYKCDKHKQVVNQHTKWEKLFNLDQIEMKLTPSAFDELETAGDVYSLMYEIGLTEQGVRKYR